MDVVYGLSVCILLYTSVIGADESNIKVFEDIKSKHLVSKTNSLPKTTSPAKTNSLKFKDTSSYEYSDSDKYAKGFNNRIDQQNHISNLKVKDTQEFNLSQEKVSEVNTRPIKNNNNVARTTNKKESIEFQIRNSDTLLSMCVGTIATLFLFITAFGIWLSYYAEVIVLHKLY